jgi:NADP-dependent 3-hydroxy acid dehydrogenase YdfG
MPEPVGVVTGAGSGVSRAAAPASLNAGWQVARRWRGSFK